MFSVRHFLALTSITLICALHGIEGPLSAWTEPAHQQDEETKVDFETQIKPLIAKHCLRCHGPEDQQADFRVDDRETVFYYIEPGDTENSEFHERLITDDEDYLMPPPSDGGPLESDEIELFKNWIAQGADWPEDATIEPPSEDVANETARAIADERQQQDLKDSTWQLLFEISGLLHPVAVHFPVALLMAGALFALLGFRGESPLSDAAYYCLWLGALMSIFAAFSGWSFAIRENYLDWQRFDFNNSIDIHRWGGILIAVLSLLLAIMAAISRRRDPYGTGAFWKLSFVLLAGLVGFVGHHGGKMTHEGLHDELMDKATIVIDNVRGQNPGENEPVEESDLKDDVDGNADNQEQGNDESGSSDASQSDVESDGDSGDDEANEGEAKEGNAKTSDDGGDGDGDDDN